MNKPQASATCTPRSKSVPVACPKRPQRSASKHRPASRHAAHARTAARTSHAAGTSKRPRARSAASPASANKPGKASESHANDAPAATAANKAQIKASNAKRCHRTLNDQATTAIPQTRASSSVEADWLKSSEQRGSAAAKRKRCGR